MKSTYLDDMAKMDWISGITTLSRTLASPVIEVIQGIRAGTVPWISCLGTCLFFQLFILCKIDLWVFRLIGAQALYPKNKYLFLSYYLSLILSGFFIWGVIQVGIKRRLTKRLTEIFSSCGLRNNLGKLPNFIFDKPIDDATRKLRITRAVLPMDSFTKAKDALNGGLQIFIDDIRENRVEGTVDIIYAHDPMPEVFRLSDIKSIGKSRFTIGITRSKSIETDLDTCPHLLIAGQTGKGKSTFLRQFITTIYLNEPKTEFTLIDLKGGLEFQLFERLPGITVPENIKAASYEIQKLSETIDKRMKLLKANHCKDILAFMRMSNEARLDAGGISKNTFLNRHIVVVDEAAEMFLAGNHASAKEIQTAKRVLSKVARQGRSLGVHLVVATQRPDSKALDSQVKANLSGVICFQMANDASSITVLGNGRATDLPPNAGRAIWKNGAEMLEVQTPLLETAEVETLLKDLYIDPQLETKPAKISERQEAEDTTYSQTVGD